MRKLATTFAALVLTVTGACGAPENLLIGKWKLDPAMRAGSFCLGSFDFAATTLTQPEPLGKYFYTIAVTYLAGQAKTFPAVVYVMTNTGVEGHVTYRFLSKDQMVVDTAQQCKYVRA